MQYTTQINGFSPSHNAHVARLLEEHGITVSHQHLDEFMITPLQDKWELHEMAADLLQAVANSSFHTVVNIQSPITQDMAIQILQAMCANRPILFSELPDFADDVDTFTQRIIASRLHNFAITNLVKLTAHQLRSAIRHIKASDVDYALSPLDMTVARAKIRNYLRDFLVMPQDNPAIEFLAD